MKTAYLLHGFNVSDKGRSTTDALIPYLTDFGYDVAELDYGWTGRIGTRLCNEKIARMIAKMALTDSLVVGHSNGCAIAALASQYGARFEKMLLINPALNRGIKFGDYPEEIHVWHSPSDWIVRVANFIPHSIWGDMGATGYVGWDTRVMNYDKENDFEMVSNSHSDVFEDDKLAYFAPRMLEALE